jgi:pyridoxal phosphate enzyme (YggS family)
LLAISKTFPAAIISAAIEAGQSRFGENRVQEAESKIPHFGQACDLEWHLVGHLQSNKARSASELFDVIHSLDSKKLAQRLDRVCTSLGKSLSVLIQVDLGREKTKFGVTRDRLRDLVETVLKLDGLTLDGLMTIPPFFTDPERTRPYFRELREMRDALEEEHPGCLGLCHLSMGMTNDFEVAIQEGSTIIRVGTAIFGERGLR